MVMIVMTLCVMMGVAAMMMSVVVVRVVAIVLTVAVVVMSVVVMMAVLVLVLLLVLPHCATGVEKRNGFFGAGEVPSSPELEVLSKNGILNMEFPECEILWSIMREIRPKGLDPSFC
jgi:hypothetical protein